MGIVALAICLGHGYGLMSVQPVVSLSVESQRFVTIPWVGSEIIPISIEQFNLDQALNLLCFWLFGMAVLLVGVLIAS